MRKVWILFMFLLLLLGVFYARETMDTQRAAIGGNVTWVAPEKTYVEEGDAILRVSALSGGNAVAARARCRGIVRKTLTAVGERVKKGDAILEIEPVEKNGEYYSQ